MAKVKFTSALKRFFPDLTETEVTAETVSELVHEIEQKYPGIVEYILEEDGRLRKHVNIFVDSDLVRDRDKLSDSISGAREVIIFQALSGG